MTIRTVRITLDGFTSDIIVRGPLHIAFDAMAECYRLTGDLIVGDLIVRTLYAERIDF